MSVGLARTIMLLFCFGTISRMVVFAAPDARLPEPGSLPGEPEQKIPILRESKKAEESVSGPSDDLVDMNISEMTGMDEVAEMVARYTGRNVIFNPTLKGKKIRIVAPRKMTKEDAYKTFLSALDMQGLSTVETGKVIKIIETRNAIRDNPPVHKSKESIPDSDELITYVLSLKYIDATWFQSTLSRFTTPGSVVPLEETNSLIISDSASKVNHILSIVTLLDVKSQQSDLKIFSVRYGQASVVAKNVQDLLAVAEAATRGGMSPVLSRSDSNIRLVHDDVRNVIGVFAPKGQMQQIETHIKALDRKPVESEYGSNIYVIPLEYADAKKMSATLSTLSASPRATQTPPVRSRISRNLPQPESGASAPLEGFKITADENSNTLLVVGDRAARESVSYVVRHFDQRRDQVLIEVQMLEVGSTNGFRAGSSFLLGQGRTDGTGTRIITGWEAGGMGPQILAGSDAFAGQSADARAKLFMGNMTDGLTIGALSQKGVNVPGLGQITPGAFMRFVKSDQNTKVLSSPYILALDNEEANLTVGEKVFFRIQKDGIDGISPQVEKEDIDLSLTVTPNIGWGDYVTLSLEMDANQLAGIDEGYPRVNKKKIKQKLTVRNGQTAVVAGSLSVSEADSQNKIPVLGDIPVLGALFRQTDRSFRNQQMIVFLTPWVVRGPEDLRRIYTEKYEESRDFLLDIKGEEAKESGFYSELPGDKAADYETTGLDIWEAGIRQKLRDEAAKAMGYLEESGATGL